MAKIWSKLKTIWPQILVIIIIIIFLLWPFRILTEKYTDFKVPLVSQIISQSNHLQVEKDISREKIDKKNVLIFGGDIMLSRTVNAKMEKYKNYNWPFEKTAALFSSADLAIANLESPFLFTDNYQVLTGSFSFKANPKSASALSLAGFDVLSLANNHILNQGNKGLLDTKKVLDEIKINYVGLLDNNLVIKESKGVKFAFLSYTYNNDSNKIANFDNADLKVDIKRAKEQADVVIVMMHAGTEYNRQPNKQQINFAHQAIDLGADLVVGHHPHWPQTTEVYNGKTIIYSLGNLIFDQMWSKDTSVGLLAKVYFDDKEQVNIEYLPININDYGQAELMPEGVAKDKLLKIIGVK